MEARLAAKAEAEAQTHETAPLFLPAPEEVSNQTVTIDLPLFAQVPVEAKPSPS